MDLADRASLAGDHALAVKLTDLYVTLLREQPKVIDHTDTWDVHSPHASPNDHRSYNDPPRRCPRGGDM